MHLKSLNLTNLRQFDQRVIEFRSGFNLLIGKNGAGKTTVLRGVIAALGAAKSGGRRPLMEDDDVRLGQRHAEVLAVVRAPTNEDIEFYCRKDLWRSAERSRNAQERPLLLVYPSNEATCSAMQVKRAKRMPGLEASSLRRSEELIHDFEVESKEPWPDSSARRFGSSGRVRPFLRKALSAFNPDFQEFYWRFEPYDCALVTDGARDGKSRLDEQTDRKARVAALRYFQEWALRRKRPYKWPDQSVLVIDPLSYRTDERVLPDLREIWRSADLPSSDLKRLESSPLEVRLSPRIMIRKSGGSVRLSQLSDGEQRLFCIFVDIARQLSLANTGRSFGRGEAIVLIDEIDVHLHPKWQRIIVPTLEELFPQCQFIATTHSPFVIQSLEPGRLISLDNGQEDIGDYSNQSIEDIVEGVQGVTMPQRAHRAEVFSTAVAEYVKIIRNPSSTKTAVRRAEKKFREAAEPYAPDPGLNALLKLEAMAADKLREP